jgi:hypothetical protein
LNRYFLLISFLVLLVPLTFAQCLTPIDSIYEKGLPATSCVGGYLHDEAGWCEYTITIPGGKDEVIIGFVSENINFRNQFDENNETIRIWVDQTTLPAYLFCAYYDPVKDDTFNIDRIEFGKSDEWLPGYVNYVNVLDDDLYKWSFGLLFILIGMFIFFDAFFNNRFLKFV